MLYTAIEPIPPPRVLDLIRAVHAVDAKAQVRIDATGRQARIEGRLTLQQLADALRDADLPGVVTGDAPAPAGGCCGCGA
jgi:hypothetical protein